jgi:hypothetical protein
MSDWAGGYIADIGYTYGYHPELNPQHARFAFLNAGLVSPALCVHSVHWLSTVRCFS